MIQSCQHDVIALSDHTAEQWIQDSIESSVIQAAKGNDTSHRSMAALFNPRQEHNTPSRGSGVWRTAGSQSDLQPLHGNSSPKQNPRTSASARLCVPENAHAKRPQTGWPLLQDWSGNLANKIETPPPQPKVIGKPQLHMVWCPCTHIHTMPKDTRAVGMATWDGSDRWTCLLRLSRHRTPSQLHHMWEKSVTWSWRQWRRHGWC